MDKRYLALAVLTSLSISMNYAVSVTDVTKSVLRACSCGKPQIHKLWDHKYLVLLTATVATGAVVAYKSEYIRGKVKKFFGIANKGRKISYRSRSLEGDGIEEPEGEPKPKSEEEVVVKK